MAISTPGGGGGGETYFLSLLLFSEIVCGRFVLNETIYCETNIIVIITVSLNDKNMVYA